MDSSEIIPCPNCGARNRVPREKTAQGLQPVCGRCKKPLVAAGPVTITDGTFSTKVERAPLPVLLDMWAPWCGPCQMIAPALEELAAEMAGRVVIGKMNVDENPMTSSRFNVRSIPTLLLLKNGREIDRITGAQPKAEIRRRLEQALAG